MLAAKSSGFWLLVAALLCGCDTLGKKGTASYISGQSQAKHDLEEGRLELETAGLPGAWTLDYERLLLERYGIRSRAVAGCLVNDQILDHARGYNEVMEREAERRFGNAIWKQTKREAQKGHENKGD